MLRCEIIRTCSHEKVAEAAVLSVGPAFRDRIALLAAASNMRPGVYVATLVRRFRDEASDVEIDGLARIIEGSDMPILEGMRWIVEVMIDGSRTGGPRTPGRSRFKRDDRCMQAA
ncbi:MAG: hypothetical protein Q8M31_20080 [Beijerinckiaceae bacterium]|nr:hypothetical protein [Beijerinckiaceae bacterium]